MVGFGSLLSERSARFTFPELCNFRSGIVRGYRRVFAHTAPIFFERGIAHGLEISSLSTEPDPESHLVVSVFEIPASDSDIEAFVEREHEVLTSLSERKREREKDMQQR